MTADLLVGNTFPLTLMRRQLMVEPVPLVVFREEAEEKRIVSFWGHANTLHAASEAVGFDLSPAEERPVLELSPEGFPMLGGKAFRECWVISPDCRQNFRLFVNRALEPEDISGWQCLRISWL